MRHPAPIGIALVLAAVSHGVVRAAGDIATTQPPPPIEVQPAAGEAAGAAAEPLLTATLGETPVGQWMAQNRINGFGWIEGSYNYNFSNPNPRLNLGHVFDIQPNEWLVNQLQLNFERTVDLSARQLDVGGRVDFLFGSDARFIHSSDFLSGSYPNPQYQFDIPQLYIDLALPLGNGVRLRFGKFEFFKFTDPNAGPLFSHTFLYAAAGQSNTTRQASTEVGASLPFTLTGITGYYEFSGQMNLEAGIGRGYDQTLTDNNGAIDGFTRLNYNFSRETQASFALISGPEITGDNSHYRTVCDLGVVHSISEDLLVIAGANYGVQARGRTLFVPKVGTVSIGGDARWYGLNATAVYRLNPSVSAAARVEWFRDEEGFTMDLGRANFYEATLGLTIKPFPESNVGRGLKIRPEIRYDCIDAHPSFSGKILNHQWIAAVDVIYNF